MGSSTLQMQPLLDSNTLREKYSLNTVLRFSRKYLQVFNEVAETKLLAWLSYILWKVQNSLSLFSNFVVNEDGTVDREWVVPILSTISSMRFSIEHRTLDTIAIAYARDSWLPLARFFLLFSLRSGRVNKAADENTRISRNTRDEKWKKENGNRWNGARRRALRVAWCRDEGETTTTVITIYTTVYDYFRNGLVRDPLFTREEGGRYERR